jgi:hypothetical protein
MKTNEKVPKMKVFTVGLDQKPPLEESKSPPSPPPGYATPSPPASVAMGPEPPIIIRKSRGYKGVLIILLSGFLIALFALTLSEIAYNRQRDENFFRLRWAELKHRMGFDYDNMHRWQERVFNLHRGQEFQPQPPMAALEVQQPVTPSTEPPKADKAIEDSDKKASIADRLQFFRQLLEGIKKQAESMGFDGTMQVSVVQVDPLSSVDDQDTKSDSFLDGFGEVHQPQQPRTESRSSSGSDENDNQMKPRRPCGFFRCEDNNDDLPNFQLPRMGVPFRPDWNGPRNFDRFGDRNEENTVDRFFPKVEMFEIPIDQQEVGTMYGRRFGRILQDIIANRLRNFQQMNSFIPPRPENTPNLQGPWWQPVRPQFPQSFPIGNGIDFNQQPNPRPFQQQQTPPPFIFFPNPQPQHFPRNRLDNGPTFPNQQQNLVPPEDRIQVEPPAQTFVDWKPWNSDNGNGFVNLNNEVNRGWTHQENTQEDRNQEQNQEQPGAAIPGPQPSSIVDIAPQASTILDGDTNEKKDAVPEQQKPILAIDPPAVDFPAVKFPMNDENNNNREHNPLFFQVDEPQQQEQPVEK